MRIVINDYSGHPFQVQLSRALASRGHTVLHVHFADFQTPKGELARRPDDPPGFSIVGLSLGRPFAKNRFVRRLFQEIEYGRRAARTALAFQPDVVVGCNNPLDAQERLQSACRAAGVPFVFWLQDLYSIAIKQLLRRRMPLLGYLIGARYQHLEQRLLRQSDVTIAITEDFLPVLEGWRVDIGRCAVVRNWAPLEAITPGNKCNAWSRVQGISDKKVVLYTGTLGLKHDPMLLVALAERLRERSDTVIVVVSEGPGSDLIAREAAARALSNLRVLPFQPFAVYADVLASADVLVAMIEPDAGIFSVPSKVLSYLCAGRPMVIAVPPENLAARTVCESKAGRVVLPGDSTALCDAVLHFLDDVSARRTAGWGARAYAERTFAIGAITDQFETVFRRAQLQSRTLSSRPIHMTAGSATVQST